eukprot:3736102-Prymnesium_polylepis.1
MRRPTAGASSSALARPSSSPRRYMRSPRCAARRATRPPFGRGARTTLATAHRRPRSTRGSSSGPTARRRRPPVT